MRNEDRRVGALLRLVLGAVVVCLGGALTLVRRETGHFSAARPLPPRFAKLLLSNERHSN